MVIECLFMKFSNKASTARLASDIFIQLTIDLFAIYFVVRLFELGSKRFGKNIYDSNRLLAEIGMGFIFFEIQHNLSKKIGELSDRLEKYICV